MTLSATPLPPIRDGRTAVITGGAGFIGSTLADALVAEGRVVHVVDDLSNGPARNVPGEATLHEMDIRAGADLASLVMSLRPATIFHLAAQTDVRRGVENPGFDADVNIVGTINVLEAARAVGARVLFSSTGGAGYGEYDGLPVPTPETAETRPMSPYGASKMAGEQYLRLYHRLHGVETVALRLANVYGPRQDPHGEAGVVAIFCGLLLEGRSPRVFGDGTQTRDYVYVGDVVEAFLAAEAGPSGATVNVGTGKEVSVLDLLDGLGLRGRARARGGPARGASAKRARPVARQAALGLARAHDPRGGAQDDPRVRRRGAARAHAGSRPAVAAAVG